jgi:hypothetical protein
MTRLVPDVIVAAPGSAVLAARQATATIPIIGINMGSPPVWAWWQAKHGQDLT